MDQSLKRCSICDRFESITKAAIKGEETLKEYSQKLMDQFDHKAELEIRLGDTDGSEQLKSDVSSISV